MPNFYPQWYAYGGDPYEAFNARIFDGVSNIYQTGSLKGYTKSKSNGVTTLSMEGADDVTLQKGQYYNKAMGRVENKADAAAGALNALGSLGELAQNVIGMADIEDTTGIENNIEETANSDFTGASSNADMLSSWNSINWQKNDYKSKDIRGMNTGDKILGVVGATGQGAAAGSQINVPWGTIAGAAVGLGAGLGGVFAGDRKARKKAAELNTQATMANRDATNAFAQANTQLANQQWINRMYNLSAYGGPLGDGVRVYDTGGAEAEYTGTEMMDPPQWMKDIFFRRRKRKLDRKGIIPVFDEYGREVDRRDPDEQEMMFIQQFGLDELRNRMISSASNERRFSRDFGFGNHPSDYPDNGNMNQAMDEIFSYGLASGNLTPNQVVAYGIVPLHEINEYKSIDEPNYNPGKKVNPNDNSIGMEQTLGWHQLSKTYRVDKDDYSKIIKEPDYYNAYDNYFRYLEENGLEHNRDNYNKYIFSKYLEDKWYDYNRWLKKLPRGKVDKNEFGPNGPKLWEIWNDPNSTLEQLAEVVSQVFERSSSRHNKEYNAQNDSNVRKVYDYFMYRYPQYMTREYFELHNDYGGN